MNRWWYYYTHCCLLTHVSLFALPIYCRNLGQVYQLTRTISSRTRTSAVKSGQRIPEGLIDTFSIFYSPLSFAQQQFSWDKSEFWKTLQISFLDFFHFSFLPLHCLSSSLVILLFMLLSIFPNSFFVLVSIVIPFFFDFATH